MAVISVADRKGLSVFEVIDCHVHPPTEPGKNFCWFLDFGVEDFFRRMREQGVHRACCMSGGLVGGPDGLKSLKESNEAALRLRERYPDFYMPAVLAHPDFPDESCAEIERAVRQEGVRWVGEIAWYDFGAQDKLDSPAAASIFGLVQDLEIPLQLHCNDLAVVRKLCERFPQLSIVLAHPRQELDQIKARVALVPEYKNLYLDLSGSGLHRYGMLWYAIDHAGAEKFLWGSDFPIGGPAGFLADVLHEPITDRDRVLVLSENFKRLTGIR